MLKTEVELFVVGRINECGYQLMFLRCCMAIKIKLNIYYWFTNFKIKGIASFYTRLKHNIGLLLILSVVVQVHAADYYITTSDLNLRSGVGKNNESLMIITKGDTVELLETIEGNWVKIQCQGKVGYSAQKYLKKIEEVLVKDEESNKGGFLFPFILFLFFIILIPVVLTQSGNKSRNKSLAIVLSFFLGFYGYQKFYLGETKKGVFSILFCWTFIPLLIGLIDFIKLVSMKDIDFDQKYNGGSIFIKEKMRFKQRSISKKQRKNSNEKALNSKTVISDNREKQALNKRQDIEKVITPSLKSIPLQKHDKITSDETVVDVNEEEFDLTIDQQLLTEKETIAPPYWPHTYVYSYSEIKHGTREQRKFYFYFKSKVTDGEFVDIQGNTNYAFILYFDFLNEYESHKDIKLLEEQFKLLGEISPKTKNYTLNSLLDELRKRTDSYSIDRLKDLEEPSYQFEQGYSDYNPDLYKLGNQYKDKLGLTKMEVRWLNKFYNPSNVFNSIEGCSVAIINIYLKVLNSTNSKLKKDNSNIGKKLEELFDKVIDKEKLKFGSYNKEGEKKWAFLSFQEVVFLTFFKSVENAVREKYSHKRKLSLEGFHPYIKSTEVINEWIGNDFNSFLDEKLIDITPPDLDTQLALNAQNVNRWKTDFTKLKTGFKSEEKKLFITGVEKLEESNQKNPNIENIFFEASKFIAKHDNVQALKYYAKYIYYDLNSKVFNNKELTKTVQKSLFKTEEQINDFKRVLADLIETKDIDKALEEINTLYVSKRKQIKLDRTEIKQVEQKHAGTVELLSGYLETDIEVLEEEQPSREEEIIIVTPQTNDSIFKLEISLNKVQEELLEKIVNNSFKIPQTEVDQFATVNNLFKNQLIDSINETCEELLEGEALIEEEDENYVIEESYYNEIVK